MHIHFRVLHFEIFSSPCNVLHMFDHTEAALRVVADHYEPCLYNATKQTTIAKLATVVRGIHGHRAAQAYHATKDLYRLLENVNYLHEQPRADAITDLLDRGAGMAHPRFAHVLELALIYACRYAHLDLARRLLEMGADVNRVFDDEMPHTTPAYAFDQEEHVYGRVLEVPRSPMLAAAQSTSPAMITMLFEAGGNVNVRDPVNGKTPLFFVIELLFLNSIRIDYNGVVELLMRYGALVDVFVVHDNRPMTPLIRLAMDDTVNVQVLHMLLAATTNIDLRDGRGRTAFMYACRYQPVEVIEAFLRYGASVHVKDMHGWTPLLHACGVHEDLEPIASVLIDAGADPNCTILYDPLLYTIYTPLIAAVEIGSVQGVELLLGAGAVAGKEVALALARDNEEMEIIELLTTEP